MYELRFIPYSTVSLIVGRVPGWSGQCSEMTSHARASDPTVGVEREAQLLFEGGGQSAPLGALLPGGIDGGGPLLRGDVAEHDAQRRGTQAQRAAD
jgi:hypothetical protein